MKAYFEPRVSAVDQNELPSWKTRRPVSLKVEYIINEVPDPKRSKRAESRIAGIINRTKLFKVRKDVEDGFDVSISETFDEIEVYEKGKMAGETFGAAGSIADSHLSFQIEYRSDGRAAHKSSSEVTMNMVLGNRSVPDSYEPMGLLRADRHLFESKIRAFIRDAHQAGAFSK